MANTYYTILTNAGLAKDAAAQASGTQIVLATMSVGDGGGNPTTPDPTQAALVNQVFSASVNAIAPNPSNPLQYTAELVVPASAGGFTIREAGLWTSDGVLFAVANTPQVYKPSTTEGAYGDTIVQMVFTVANADTVSLVVDPTISVATRDWVENYAVPANIFPGGLTTQFLAKKSNVDGDWQWVDPNEAINITVDTVEEDQTLAAGQTAITLAKVTTEGLGIYIAGERIPSSAWTENSATTLTLAQSYPAGTQAIFVQNEQTGSTSYLQAANNLSDVSNADTARGNLNAAWNGQQIIAGTGLTGGGTLSADRTLSINFVASGQTSSSLAVRADDSRLSNARLATKLQTAVNIGIGGVGSGSISFDGSSNVSIPLALNATGVVATSYGSGTSVGSFTVGADGRITSAGGVAIAFPVTSVFGRTGAVTLASADVTGALGYTPLNKAGDYASAQLGAPQLFANSGVASYSAQGGYIAWNRSAGNGEMDFINNQGGGIGGFNFYNTSGAGTSLTSVGRIDNAGNLTMPGNVTATGWVQASQNFASTSPNCVVGTSGASSGAVYIRPYGPGSATGQAVFYQSGQLNVAGAVVPAGGFQDGSSITIKTRVRNNPYGLREIERIRTRRFKYKKKYNRDGRDRIGVIAEELQKIIPEAVFEQAEGPTPYTVEYNQIVPVLVKAIQELSAQNKLLNKRLTKIEGKRA